MNAILTDAIAEGLASLERVQATPTGDLGYGVDLVCALDLDPNMAETDPTSPVGIGQALVRRWDCPRGALPPVGKDAQEYGISLRSYVNVGTTQRDLNTLKRRLEAEALRIVVLADQRQERTLGLVPAIWSFGPGLGQLLVEHLADAEPGSHHLVSV